MVLSILFPNLFLLSFFRAGIQYLYSASVIDLRPETKVNTAAGGADSNG